MDTGKNISIVFALCTIIFVISIGAQTNTVRIAHGANIGSSVSNLYPGFLTRAKNDGYTHVMWYMPMLNSSLINPTTGAEQQALITLMTNVFEMADQYGLRLIPNLTLGSGWDCGTWSGLGGEFDPTVTPAVWNINGTCATSPAVSASFAPDAKGIDLVLPGVIRGIAAGFAAAKVARGFSYNLDYIHLGGDECLNYSNLTMLIGQCQNDINAITKLTRSPTNLSVPDAHRRLYATAIQRWVNIVTSNSPGTKVIRYSDMFDQGSLGGIALKTSYTGYSSTFTTWQAISQSAMTSIKTSLVLMPWVTGNYNVPVSFAGIMNNGFKMIWSDALIENSINGINHFDIAQARSIITAAKNPAYSGFLLGYCSLTWDTWSDPPNTPSSYNNMEILSYWNKVTRPTKRMIAIPQQVINGAINIPSLLVGATEATQGDFLSVTGFFPFSNYSTGNCNLPAENLSYYDAILYCNMRSKMEHLDTVYTYTGLPQYRVQLDTISLSIGGPEYSSSQGNCINLTNLSQNTNKNGYRLPTINEWQYAYLSGTSQTANNGYYWTTGTVDNYAWYIGNSSNTTHTVGGKLPNNWGLYDMAGNVCEWLPNGTITPCYGAGGCYASGASGLNVSSGLNGSCPASWFANSVGFRVVRKYPGRVPIDQLLQ